MLKFVLTAIYLGLLITLLYQPISIPDDESLINEYLPSKEELNDEDQALQQKLVKHPKHILSDSITSYLSMPLQRKTLPIRAKIVSR